jgi:GNAT superfamily N-acetyltransferase
VDLPPGLSTRPLTLADAPAVAAIMAAQEIADLGEALIEEADIVGDWQRPSFDITTRTIGVFDGARLVGYAEVSGSGRGDAAVDPDSRGRGIGTALAAWMRETARLHGDTTIGMPVPVGSSSEKLLRSLGYQPRWTSWVLALLDGKTVQAQPLPEGFAIRTAEPRDHTTAWTVAEDAFLEWSKRERQPFDDWAAGVLHRPGFEPWMLRVAVDPDDQVVGISHVVIAEGCAYIDKLAVRVDQRRRGIARALLVDSFEIARQHGAHRSELSTDSRTGALDLYLKLGMEVTSTWVNLGVSLA